jgi:hypothetical protein
MILFYAPTSSLCEMQSLWHTAQLSTTLRQERSHPFSDSDQRQDGTGRRAEYPWRVFHAITILLCRILVIGALRTALCASLVVPFTTRTTIRPPLLGLCTSKERRRRHGLFSESKLDWIHLPLVCFFSAC